ncbi:MAG: DUF1552 domain-containing protein [Myxococcales bacterium]|nr:DUF1552 domain-containing protein [Myxococcales bacterium]
MNKTVDRDRRKFLEFIGKAGVTATVCRTVPLIGGLMATRRAQAQSAVKRVVFVYASNGAPNGLWLPSGTELNVATQAYEGLQSVCNFREVDVVGSGHGTARKALGEVRYDQDWTGDTIDQNIASVVGTTTPFASYALGVQTENPQEVIGRKSGDSVPCQDSPSAAFSQLFSGASPSAGVNPEVARNRKLSILDLHRNEIAGMKNELGSLERETLEKHEAAIQEIESRLSGSSAPSNDGACASPSWNANGYPTNGGIEVPFAHTTELQADLIVLALQCGITNVMTLQLGYHQATWYAHNTQHKADYHGSCHAAPPVAMAEMVNYMNQGIAYLIRRLLEEDDPALPGTKMLDNTVVVQVTDMGNGQDHSSGNGPNMVATRMPSFKQGTVGTGGNNLAVLEAVVEGLGLGAFKGRDPAIHKIWACNNGVVNTGLLA